MRTEWLSGPAEWHEPVRVSSVISALSYALDLTEGQPMGHAVRTCVVGMGISREIEMSRDDQSDLYYALLMKDAGCGSDAPAQLAGTTDFQARETAMLRCRRGASIVRRMGLSAATARAIGSVDEHWDGSGYPRGLSGEAIPMAARILNLAQHMDHAAMSKGRGAAIALAQRYSGVWFDPELVRAYVRVAARQNIWECLDNAAACVAGLEPEELVWRAGEETLDNLCLAFAGVIDAKSPFTFHHSMGVAGAATAIAQTLGLAREDLRKMRRAGLLHDIGKLAVPNAILDKPGALTAKEWAVVRGHPFYTREILRRTPCLNRLADLAASHHEKLDGSGYDRGLPAEQISLEVRILVVADIYDALRAPRPYRDRLPEDDVLRLLQKDAPRQLDSDCVAALRCSIPAAESITAELLRGPAQPAAGECWPWSGSAPMVPDNSMR